MGLVLTTSLVLVGLTICRLIPNRVNPSSPVGEWFTGLSEKEEILVL